MAQNDVLQALPGLILIRKVQDSPKRSFSIGIKGFLVLISLPCAYVLPEPKTGQIWAKMTIKGPKLPIKDKKGSKMTEIGLNV